MRTQHRHIMKCTCDRETHNGSQGVLRDVFSFAVSHTYCIVQEYEKINTTLLQQQRRRRVQLLYNRTDDATDCSRLPQQ